MVPLLFVYRLNVNFRRAQTLVCVHKMSLSVLMALLSAVYPRIASLKIVQSRPPVLQMPLYGEFLSCECIQSSGASSELRTNSSLYSAPMEPLLGVYLQNATLQNVQHPRFAVLTFEYAPME